MLLDVWERLHVLCSQNCEAQQYDFGSVVERAVELGAKRLIICDPGEFPRGMVDGVCESSVVGGGRAWHSFSPSCHSPLLPFSLANFCPQ